MNKYLGFPPKKDVSICYIYIYTHHGLSCVDPFVSCAPMSLQTLISAPFGRSQTHPKSCWCIPPSLQQKGSRSSTLAPKRSEESCAMSCWRAASCATTNMPRRSCRKRFSMRHSRLDQGNTSVFSVGNLSYIYMYIYMYILRNLPIIKWESI